MTESARAALERKVDEQRAEIAALLDGLDDTQARARLVPSLTTVLGLVTHATFVEQVWFHHRVAGVPRAEVGVPETVDESFTLPDDATVASVRTAYLAACERSRAIAAEHAWDEVFTWHDRSISLADIHLHLVAELARHAGHGDILREQVLATVDSAARNR